MRNIQKNDYWFSFINVQVYQINQNIKSDHEMNYMYSWIVANILFEFLYCQSL